MSPQNERTCTPDYPDIYYFQVRHIERDERHMWLGLSPEELAIRLSIASRLWGPENTECRIASYEE